MLQHCPEMLIPSLDHHGRPDVEDREADERGQDRERELDHVPEPGTDDASKLFCRNCRAVIFLP